ncbi:hypothetical protein [Bradyrhizobium sp. CCBAU 11357]|uniref:hypothetical protein n=1 Tax=Bradyrhizobium sp. CCBAU 11357 TaxID=1630808 RepID=UPI002302C774|nr:hypothetical protein [Bradyrhizobium sp. CCBAU 11357]
MSYAEALARLRKAVTKRLITLEVINLDADLLPDFFPNCQNFGAEIYVTKQKRGCFSSRVHRPQLCADGNPAANVESLRARSNSASPA